MTRDEAVQILLAHLHQGKSLSRAGWNFLYEYRVAKGWADGYGRELDPIFLAKVASDLLKR